MLKWSNISLLISFAFLLNVLASAQSKNDLEKQKKNIKKDIEYKNSLLEETQKNTEHNLSQLIILEKKISSRERLIRTINKEINLLSSRITETNALIESMESDLKNLRDEYARMIYYAFKNRNSYDRMMFVFSSDDFNQAYKRLKYYQQYTEYRKKQALLIEQTQKLLNEKVKELEIARVEKKSLLNSENQERGTLTEEQAEQQVVIAGLQLKEKALKDDIRQKRLESVKLQKAITRIIEEEIRKAKEKKTIVLTPEAQEISTNFSNNKSKLPWPVEKGVVTGSFGEHPHPILKGIRLKNNGIDITTNNGSDARAVFDGKVTGVVVIQGAGRAVMVRHGEFLTVYSNLNEVYVSKGQQVSMKDPIGSINNDPTSGKTVLHFELWHSKTILDPASWIYKGR